MPKGPIPPSFYDLLESTAFAFVSTLGRQGEPQVSPIWFLWDGDRVRLSLLEGRQKHRNLARDGRIAIAIAHPDNPYRYLEIRGRVASIEPDAGNAVISAISRKYTGRPYEPQAGDGAPYVATVSVERHTFQDPADAPGEASASER